MAALLHRALREATCRAERTSELQGGVLVHCRLGWRDDGHVVGVSKSSIGQMSSLRVSIGTRRGDGVRRPDRR